MPGGILSPAGVAQGSHGDHLVCTTGCKGKYMEDEELSLSFQAESQQHAPVGLDIYLEHAASFHSERHQQPVPGIDGTPPDWLLAAPLSQDGTLSVDKCIQLEERWMLWHEFMKEHSRFNDWLQLAEKSAASPNSGHVLYVTAKEELKKFEVLQAEARARLAQLDGLHQQHRALLLHFAGAMAGRLAGMVRDCSQRWDALGRTVDSVCRRLKHFVAQREEFEGQREEMAVWLADMELQLTQVEHTPGMNPKQKMLQLQSFQVMVGENAERLSRLLERGETLIQRSEPTDAQDIEGELQDLLLYLVRVFDGVGRLHTRLLSMRLVFEEDWMLSPPPVSDCPSEIPQEDESVFKKSSISDQLEQNALPSPDQLVLEWDPSVDVGGSVSLDDADSAYFSSVTGILHTCDPGSREMKRWSYLSSMGSMSDTAPPETGVGSNVDCAGPAAHLLAQTFASDLVERVSLHPPLRNSSTSFLEPVTFDPERISAWLGETYRHASEVPGRRPCSRAVQTEHVQECTDHSEAGGQCYTRFFPQTHPCHAQLCDSQVWASGGRLPNSRSLEEGLYYRGLLEAKVDVENRLNEPRRTSGGPRLLGAPRFLWLLKATMLLYLPLGLLLAMLTWLCPEGQELGCPRTNALARSLHLTLHYVNGPPPT